MNLSKRDDVIASIRRQIRAAFARIENDSALRMIEDGLDEAAVEGAMAFHREAWARGEAEVVSDSIVVMDLLAAGCDDASIGRYLSHKQRLREEEVAQRAREARPWQRVDDAWKADQ
jgi:hypothetical protein